MGYRSDGLWVIKGDKDVVLAAWTAALMLTPETKIDDAGRKEVLDSFSLFEVEGTGYIRMEYSDWKWYESFPDIQFYEQLWNHFVSYAEQGLSGHSIRIGENDDDIERHEFGKDYFNVSVSRAIVDEEPYEGKPLIAGAPKPAEPDEADATEEV